MTERKPKPEEGFRMRSTRDGRVVEMDPATASRAMATYTAGGTLPAFVPIGPVPGFVFSDDGGTVATSFDPEQAIKVAQKQGGKNYPYRLAFGKDDPAFKAAKVYHDDQILRNIGKNKGFGEVFGERMADVATFGAYGAIQDENEEEAIVRAHQNVYNPIASTAGTFGGIAVSLLFPYGAAARGIGGAAMGAGRASGLVRSAQVASAAAKGTKGAGNLLQLTARATSHARKAIGARTSSTFAKNYGGGLVAAAVAEAPLSLAIAAADIVDYNKEFSAQALVADAGALYLTGVGIAAAIGLPASGLRSAAGASRRAAAGSGLGRVGNEVISVGESIAARKSFGGNSATTGAIKYRAARFAGEWIRKRANSPLSKKLTGEFVEDFIEEAATARTLVTGLKVTHQRTPAALKAALEKALPYANSPEMASHIRRALANPEDVIAAGQSINILRHRTLPRFNANLRNLATKAPADDIYRIAPWKNVAFKADWDDLAKATGPFAPAKKALSKDLNKLLSQTKSNPKQVTEKLLQAKQAIKDANIGPGKNSLVSKIDDELLALTNNDPTFRAQVVAHDDITKAFGELSDYFDQLVDLDDFVGGADGVDTIHKHLIAMEGAAKNANVGPGIVKQITKEVDIFEKASIKNGMEGLAGVNAFRRAVLLNDGAGIASALKLPKGQLEALGFGDELLDAQIESVMGFKSNTAKALQYLTLTGTPRGSVAFGGVLAYRAFTADVKRQHFELYREILLDTAASPERLIASIGDTAGHLAATDMEAGVAYSTTLATASVYLLQQMPRSSDPMIGPADFSMQEIDSFLESVGALESPASVLASARDGSTSIEGVDAVKVVYPELYTDMVLDLAEFMQTKEWEKLNHAQRIGLDTFTGGALGVLQSYGPMPGPLFAQTPMQQQALGTNRQQSSPEMARLQGQMNSTASQKVSGL